MRDALAAGATTIVGLGGDGTWSNIAAALVATSLHNGALTSEAIATLMKTQRRD